MLFKNFIGVIMLLALGGCASMAVTEADLDQRTSFSLGMDKNEFTISERVDSGVRTDYVVKTKSGETYRCYVTGTISVTGRIVSDAICSGKAGSDKTPEAATCNDLLKAAGEC